MIRKAYGSIAVIGLGLVAHAGYAGAQGLDFAAGDDPVTIDANDGIEWQRDRSAYVARGNATATRGDTSVRAYELIAYYQPESDGSDIYRIDAVGDVVILGPEQRVVGDRAVYDVVNGIVVVTGDNLSLTTPTKPCLLVTVLNIGPMIAWRLRAARPWPVRVVSGFPPRF